MNSLKSITRRNKNYHKKLIFQGKKVPSQLDMKQSQLFTKTTKDTPKDEVSKNAQLLMRAGYVYKEMAGIYTLLPLGVRVVNKIAQIIREEMDAVGGVEMQSAALQRQEVWEKTRWSDEVVDNWFKTKLVNGTELGLAFTHEEPLAAMMRHHINSYKDLPAYPYDIRSVFRNEARAKSGLMRGREFFWKALYSFSKNKEQHDKFYENIKQAYINVFNRVGIGETTYVTFASGGSFSKYSHEFQTLSEAGEDVIYIDEKSGIAVNKEVYTDEVLADLGLQKEKLIEKKAVETGNIFSLGEKFSKPAGLTYKDENGEEQLVYMGSYGIGITRLLGVVAEEKSDENGIIWPEAIAPFKVHLLMLGNDEAVSESAQKLYKELQDKNIEVLFDDRASIRPGEKFADSDLIGIPYRVVVSKRSLENNNVELKKRDQSESNLVSIDKIVNVLQNTQ